MLRADKLSTYYSGIATENLTDVELTHANALVDFEVVGAPAGAKMFVNSSNVSITPYKAGENRYKAIVFAEGGEFDAEVTVSISGTSYSVSLREAMKTKSHPITGPGHVQRNTHYKFTVSFDPTNNTLSIKDLQKSKWSDSGTWMPEE